MERKQEKVNKIFSALQKVEESDAQLAASLALKKRGELTDSFNRVVVSFFDYVIGLAKSLKLGKNILDDLQDYQSKLNTALNWKNEIPIDTFALNVLEFAPQIYAQNDEFFLNRKIKNRKVEVEDGCFKLLDSEFFKDHWRALSEEQKRPIKDNIVFLTLYAHAFTLNKLNQGK